MASGLNEKLLQHVTLITSGAYVSATSGDYDLRQIYDEVRRLEKREIESRRRKEYVNRYQWVLLPGLLLILLEFVVSERKTARGSAEY